MVNDWDKLTNVRDNMIRKDNEKNLSLSAASLTEVGYRGELGIDGPGLIIVQCTSMKFGNSHQFVANRPSSKPTVVEVIDSLFSVLFLLELHIHVPNLI